MKVRYKVRVNKAGLIFIGITVFLGFAAVNTANNLLYMVVSYMLSFMLFSGLFSLYNIRGLEVVLLPPEEVYAGTELPVRVIVKNHKRLPSFLIELRKENSRCVFPVVSVQSEGSIKLLFERRGYYESLDLELSSSFPVGLFERFYTLKATLNLVVFPKPLPCGEVHLLTKKEDKSSTLPASRKKGYEDIAGIREYTNEPIKLVHWKLSAKTGNLYVKDMVEETAPPVMLSLESVEGTMEECISKLTFLILKLTSANRPVGLELPTKTIKPSVGVQHKRELLTQLSLL
ncbi:MAG: DUF58 domain-containing protein [Aquificaceae bacterium]|nr:DUF58 domain-containing protein [Aquificaceae bacterium]